MPSRALILLVLVVLVTGGCGAGGTLSKKAFQTDAESIHSLAAEGALVAQSAAEDRTTDNFVRVHTRYLRKGAEKLATKLGSAKAPRALEPKRREAVRIAGRVADELDRLQSSPGDSALAGRLTQRLENEAEAAEKLAK